MASRPSSAAAGALYSAVEGCTTPAGYAGSGDADDEPESRSSRRLAPHNGGDTRSTSKSEKRNSAKDSKGNVIVSVRVRPEVNPGQDGGRAELEWMVDGRKAAVAYRGKEGGDYRYGT